MIALVLGGSPSVWTDLKRAEELIEGLPRVVVGSNFAGRDYPGHLDGWATLHPEQFEPWREGRAKAGRNTDYRAIVHAPKPPISGAEVLPERWAATSGFFAAQAGLELFGADGAILCGVPMEAEAGHYAERGDWPDPAQYIAGVRRAKAEDAPIRSMSGWTAELFGEPDGAWLAGLGFEIDPTRRVQPMEADMWVRFTKAFDYTPSRQPRVQIAYPAGYEGSVTRECGEAAIEVGRAVEVQAPKRAAKSVKADG